MWRAGRDISICPWARVGFGIGTIGATLSTPAAGWMADHFGTKPAFFFALLAIGLPRRAWRRLPPEPPPASSSASRRRAAFFRHHECREHGEQADRQQGEESRLGSEMVRPSIPRPGVLKVGADADAESDRAQGQIEMSRPARHIADDQRQP